MGTERVALRDVTKVFAKRPSAGIREDVTAIAGVTFQVFDKEIVSLVGPSGCGKSTILGLVSGLMFPTRGVVTVDAQSVTGPSDRIGFMLQKDLLLPWKSVADNVELGQKIRGVERATRRATAEALLAKYGLTEFAHHYPWQLSGGLRQRVALARTLAIQPEILLLDEPFSALDFQTRLLLQQDLYTILREYNRTVIFITHDIGEAIVISDRVLVMSKRPGRIKMSIDIHLPATEDLLQRRQSKEFAEYFQQIWDNLEHHLDVA